MRRRHPVKILFFGACWGFACLLVASCTGKRTPASSDTPARRLFCTPGEPQCTKVLPDAGSYKAQIEISVQALNPPPPAAEPDAWTDPITRFEQQETVELVRDAHGNVRGVRNLSDEEGLHFARVGQIYCVGFRYEPAVCRTPDEGEVEMRIAEFENTYAEILARLPGRLEWKDIKGEKIARLEDFQPDKNAAMEVHALSGRSFVDGQSGDIHLELAFDVEGRRPDNLRYRLRVRYAHVVSKSAEPVQLPENVLHHEGRHRPLMDRKALLGDPIPAPLQRLYGYGRED